MKIKVNNYCKGAFKNQLQQGFNPVSSSSNNNIYVKQEYEYRGKVINYHAFSRKGTRQEIKEIQILCSILKEV